MGVRAAAVWEPGWDLEAARAALAVADPALVPALRVPLPPRPARGLVAQLVRAICAQQVSVAAADALEVRLWDACGGEVSAQALLRLGAEGVRAAGLSRAKASCLQSMAEAMAQGRLDQETMAGKDDETVIGQLVALPGIGRWTAEMVLLFGLHRPDVWPASDLGIRIAVGLLEDGGGRHAVPRPAAVAARGHVWRPHRSTAALALWAWRRSLREGGTQGTVE